MTMIADDDDAAADDGGDDILIIIIFINYMINVNIFSSTSS